VSAVSASHRRPRAVRALLVLLLIAHAPRGLAQEPALVAAPWQVQGILSALGDALPAVRAKALERIATFDRIDGIPASRLSEFFKTPDASVRRTAATALGAMRARDQAAFLVSLLQDADDRVKDAASEALGAMEARNQIPRLVTLLANANPDTRCAAAKALGHLKATDRIPELVVLLNDPDSGARWGAVEGLEKLGPISAGLMAGSTPRDSRDRTVDAAARFNCHYLTGGNPAACLAALEPAP